MQTLLFFSALVCCVLSLDQNDILNKHAAERAQYGVGPLSWDDTLAQVAANYASRCIWEHNSGRGSDYASLGGSGSVGENLACASGQSVGIDGWIEEKQDWDCASNSCNGVCGHYTQMIWASTSRVGCAEQECSTGSPFGSFNGGRWTILVCDYASAGNMNGARPVSSCSGGGSPVPYPMPVSPVPSTMSPVPRPYTPSPRPTMSPVPRPYSAPTRPRYSPRPSGGCTDTPSPQVTISGSDDLAPCSMVADFDYCSYAPLPYCAKSCHGCSSTASATATVSVDENADTNSDSTTVQVSDSSDAIPGWGVGLLVLGSILVTLLIVVIALMLSRKPSSERF